MFHIIELKLWYDTIYNKWQYSTEVVYKTIMEMLVLQVVRMNEQINDYDYTYDNKVNQSDNKVMADALFLLDEALRQVVYIERQEGSNKFREIEKKDLTRVEGL